jgi:hypothetical protein
MINTPTKLFGQQAPVKVEYNSEQQAKVTEFESLGKPVCRILNWVRLGGDNESTGGCLWGDVRDHPRIGNEDDVRTSRIVYFNEAAGVCQTKNTLYILQRKAGA